MAYREGLAADPATHVLVIGVDDYRHLPYEGGGGGPRTRGDDYAPGLTKISTAGPSAELIADWFLDASGFNNPQRSLGSLDILLSSGNFKAAGGVVEAVAKPTFSAIRSAFAAWRDRLHAHEDNHAILYFCGHGMEEINHYLLPEDVLDDPAAVDENFIDLDATIVRMAQCRASTQLYFIDACRSPFPHKLSAISTNVLSTGGKTFGRALIAPPASAASFRRNAMVFKSALKKGQPAKARVGKESYFAEALVECLNHFGADDDANSGEYWVHIDSLQKALFERMRRKAVQYGIPGLGCDFDAKSLRPEARPDLHLIAAAKAKVQSHVVLVPDAAHAEATIKLSANQPGGQTYERLPSPEAWIDELVPGAYDVSASFNSSGYRNPKSPALVMMPTYNGRWPVT